MIKKTTLMVFILIVATLNGCSTVTKVLPEHKVTLTIQASSDLNPDDSGRASPLYVQIYQLRKPDVFNSAEFFNLYQAKENVLADTLVSTQTINVLPSQKKQVQFVVSGETKYIGVLAAYNNIAVAKWRQTIRLHSTWGNENIRLCFDKDVVKQCKEG